MKDIKIYIGFTLLMSMAMSVLAQEESWEKPAGSIENAQVVIEKDKQINLRPVSRRFKSIQIELPQPQAIQTTLQLSPTLDSLASLQVIVRPKTMRDQPLEKLYGLTAKLGYGNYRSPFVLVNAGNKRSDEYLYNAQFHHFSSGKGAVNDAPYYSTRFGMDGRLYMNNLSLYSAIAFHNQNYRIYGYDPDEFPNISNQDVLKQKLNNLSFLIGVEDNNSKNNSDQAFEVGINLLKNNHADKEFILNTKYKLTWEMADDWQLHLIAGYSLLNQNVLTNGSIKRHLASVSPVFKYHWNSFLFSAGANGYFQQDPLDQLESKLYVFPNLEARYSIAKNHSVSLALTGDVEQVSQQTMYGENLYLDSLVSANNNIRDFNMIADLAGKLSETFGYSLSYDYSHFKRLMFYDNAVLDTGRFVVRYDNSGATRHSFSGNINYLRNENLKFNLGARYNVYKTSDVAEAWHKPALELNFGSKMTFIDKLHVNIRYNLLSGIKARDSFNQVKTLDLVNDLNLGMELDISERAGLFLDFRNIIGQNYQLYNNYPVNGFQVIGGFSVRF